MNFSAPFLPPLQPFGLRCLKRFLSLFLKWTISPSPLLFLTSCPPPWQEAPAGSGLTMIGRRIKLFNFWSEFAADPALTIVWGSFPPLRPQFTCYEGKPRATDQPVCREALASQIICNLAPALTENVHAAHRTQKVQAEAQLPKNLPFGKAIVSAPREMLPGTLSSSVLYTTGELPPLQRWESCRMERRTGFLRGQLRGEFTSIQKFRSCTGWCNVC